MPGQEPAQGAVTWAAAFLLGVSIGRWVRQWREKRREDLSGTVPASSQLIAAGRAVESLELEEGKLFDDPLAATLAGPAQFSKALREAQPIAPDAEGPPGRRLYRISVVAARTWFIDTSLAAALAESAAAPAPSPRWLPARIGGSRPTPQAPLPRQVVVLGSGMDTRPWRMALPPGVKWIEVDMPQVVKAKRRALARAGAQLDEEAPRGRGGGIYQLRAESWAAVSADLQGDDWVEALVAAGLNITEPVVWLAEGLLMYLPPGAVAALLARAAASCAPGSTFIGHTLSDEFVQRLHAGGEVSMAGTPYDAQLVKTWLSGLPHDPTAPLAETGWRLRSVTNYAGIAAQVCGGRMEGKCAFDATDDINISHFWVATK